MGVPFLCDVMSHVLTIRFPDTSGNRMPTVPDQYVENRYKIDFGVHLTFESGTIRQPDSFPPFELTYPVFGFTRSLNTLTLYCLTLFFQSIIAKATAMVPTKNRTLEM